MEPFFNLHSLLIKFWRINTASHCLVVLNLLLFGHRQVSLSTSFATIDTIAKMDDTTLLPIPKRNLPQQHADVFYNENSA